MNPLTATLDELRERSLVDFSSQVALQTNPTALTFAEFWRAVDEQQRQLPALSPRSPVGVISPNSPDLVLHLFALWQAGVVAAPLNPAFPEKLRTSLLQEIGATAVWEHTGEGISRWSLLAGRSEVPAPIDVLICTSGSTGPPKAVGLSMANFLWNAAGSAQNIEVTPQDRWLLSLPLFHVGGLSILFRTLLAGAASVMSLEKISWELISEEQITHLSLVPTQLQKLLASRPRVCPPLKAVLLGGAAIPASLLTEAVATGLPIHTSYGCTEMASQVATTPRLQAPAFRRSAPVLPFREAQIAEDGRIQLRGKTRFHGYWRDGALTQPFDAEGWFTTSDVGSFDDAQRLQVIGRADRMFISGGENIHPETIERALLEHPHITQAVVVDVPDQRFGARPVAFLQQSESSAEKELRAFLQERIPRFQLPDAFFAFPEESLAGLKPNLSALRTWAQQHHTTTKD